MTGITYTHACTDTEHNTLSTCAYLEKADERQLHTNRDAFAMTITLKSNYVKTPKIREMMN